MTVFEQLMKFYNDEWEIDDVYDMNFFVERFGCSRSTATELLTRMSDMGLVVKVRDGIWTYYIRGEWYGPFEPFRHMINAKDKRAVE